LADYENGTLMTQNNLGFVRKNTQTVSPSQEHDLARRKTAWTDDRPGTRL